MLRTRNSTTSLIAATLATVSAITVGIQATVVPPIALRPFLNSGSAAKGFSKREAAVGPSSPKAIHPCPIAHRPWRGDQPIRRPRLTHGAGPRIT